MQSPMLIFNIRSLNCEAPAGNKVDSMITKNKITSKVAAAENLKYLLH